MLTVITPVHRNLDGLINLYEKFRQLKDCRFFWIIKDSAKCNETKKWLMNLKEGNIAFYSESDCGIYPAINFALTKCSTPFYMVVGSDDDIFLESFYRLLDGLSCGCYDNYDIITFPVFFGSKLLFPNKYLPISFSVGSLITQHSVGTVLRKSVHEKFSFYDEYYNILADSAFIKQAFIGGAKFHYDSKIITGIFSTGGVSTINHLDRILEAFRYNFLSNSSFKVQFLFLFLRFCKYRYMVNSRTKCNVD